MPKERKIERKSKWEIGKEEGTKHASWWAALSPITDARSVFSFPRASIPVPK